MDASHLTRALTAACALVALSACAPETEAAPPQHLEDVAVADVEYLGQMQVTADLDGDGAATFATGKFNVDDYAGVVDVWHHLPAASSEHDLRIAASSEDSARFAHVWSAGPDATGDGIPDILVAAEPWSGTSSAYLLSGGLLTQGR